MSPHRREPRVFISAGEVSGDIVAAKLVAAIRAENPSASVHGLGGERMAAAGATLVTSADHLGAVGVSEGLAVVPSGLRILRNVSRHIDTERPDVAVLVGNDVFNRVLARSLRARGIPTVALFPPQVWVWQPLVPFFARALDLVLASFPEEERRYRLAGTETVFVGHYLADVLEPVTERVRLAARRSLGLSESGPVVGLLPGSRAHEIQRLMPALLDAADALRAHESRLQAVVALAARGESPAAFGAPNAAAALGTPFDGRCIASTPPRWKTRGGDPGPGGFVAPPSNTAGILGRRASPAGCLARLGATPVFHHGPLADGARRDVGGGIQTRGGLAVRATGDSHTAMRAADVVLCCSGTATLEAALLGIPMVVVYKVSRTTFRFVRLCIGLGLLPSDTIALPNLILGRNVVPELKQHAVVPSAIAAAAAPLIADTGARRAMCAGLAEVRALVERRGTLARAAGIVLEQASPGRRRAANGAMVPLPPQWREGE